MGAGISIQDQYTAILGIVIDATHNLIMACEGAASVCTHITSTSSLAGVWEGTMENVGAGTVTEAAADWFPLPSAYQNGTAITNMLPGATYTPTDDDESIAITCGARYVRFRRTAGSGTANASLSNASLQDIFAAANGGATVAVTETKADDAAFTIATSKVFPMGALADETSPDSVDEGDVGAFRMTLSRILKGQALRDSGVALHNGKEYTVLRAAGSITATGALIAAIASKFNIILDLVIWPKSGVTDTYYLSDTGGNLLGDSTAPLPLSSAGTAGPAGLGKEFSYGIKTTAVNKDITLTIGSGGDAGYYVAYIQTTD